MKTEAIELHPALATEAAMPALSLRQKVSAYVELTKPRITFLIVLTSAAGFCLGSRGAVDYVIFTHAMIGIALLSSGIGTLNQFMERDLDALMRRTADRPLPTNRLLPVEALWFGLALTVTAEVYLASLVNLLTAIIAASLLIVQLGLGVTAYIVRAASPNDPQPLNPMISVTVAHVACGALVFAATIVLTLRVFRILQAERSAYALATA